MDRGEGRRPRRPTLAPGELGAASEQAASEAIAGVCVGPLGKSRPTVTGRAWFRTLRHHVALRVQLAQLAQLLPTGSSSSTIPLRPVRGSHPQLVIAGEVELGTEARPESLRWHPTTRIRIARSHSSAVKLRVLHLQPRTRTRSARGCAVKELKQGVRQFHHD